MIHRNKFSPQLIFYNAFTQFCLFQKTIMKVLHILAFCGYL